MAKIQNIGVGNYIRNPRRRLQSGRVQISEVLKIQENHGNSYLCFPVKDPKANPVTLDTTKYQFIPVDTEVEQVTI